MESPQVEEDAPQNLACQTKSTPSVMEGPKKKNFFETKSLAEVYAKQGHISMALEIYERIQQRNPIDDQIKEKIS